MSQTLEKSPHTILTKELKNVIYCATKSEKEFEFFKEAFEKMPKSEIQKVLDAFYNSNLISITKRDVMKSVLYGK